MELEIEPQVAEKLEALAVTCGVSRDSLLNRLLKCAFDNVKQAALGANPFTSPARIAASAGAPSKTLADQIRDYVIESVVKPARTRGDKEITVRAGDVHRALNLRNRLPAVCAALGSGIFLHRASVRRKKVEGPANGSNTEFTFWLE